MKKLKKKGRDMERETERHMTEREHRETERQREDRERQRER